MMKMKSFLKIVLLMLSCSTFSAYAENLKFTKLFIQPTFFNYLLCRINVCDSKIIVNDKDKKINDSELVQVRSPSSHAMTTEDETSLD
ncbi:hypothetical protein [Aliikangiella maris]|uniref:Uncharacterized protein n=2 Tax=Aliikangiella maris TaxID=3162458 RepID=A0ABV3MLB3_9GAMM